MELTGIGVAGCGRMGAPMLGALIKAGFDAVGYDVRPPEEFGPLAKKMQSIQAFSQDLTTLISVVRDIPQTE